MELIDNLNSTVFSCVCACVGFCGYAVLCWMTTQWQLHCLLSTYYQLCWPPTTTLCQTRELCWLAYLLSTYWPQVSNVCLCESAILSMVEMINLTS